jgi:hypothetical protein
LLAVKLRKPSPPHWDRDCAGFQALFCRRRHQPMRRAPAKIRRGSSALAGTWAASSRRSTSPRASIWRAKFGFCNGLAALGEPIHVISICRCKTVFSLPRFQRSLNCLSYAANSKRVGHDALLWPAGGSAIGLSATDADGVAVGGTRHTITAMTASLRKPPRKSLC